MKKTLLIALTLTLFSCQKEPEFYINGVPYYTWKSCAEYEKTTNFEYHYGYSVLRGRWCWHWGNNTTKKCIKEKIDTIQVRRF